VLQGKKVLAVIPARGGSKGVHLKNIQPVQGVPLVARVGHLVKQISMIDLSVLSTDHPEIKKIGEESGLFAPFFRPPELSGDSIGDMPVLNHALDEIENKNNCIYDIIVMLQPTSPLRQKRHVEDTIKKLVYENFDSVWTISTSDSKNHPLKQLKINCNLLNHYKLSGQKIVSRQQLDTLYHRNGVAYSMTREYLQSYKRTNDKSMQALPLQGYRVGFILIDEPVVNIDSRWEFSYAEFLLNQNDSRN